MQHDAAADEDDRMNHFTPTDETVFGPLFRTREQIAKAMREDVIRHVCEKVNEDNAEKAQEVRELVMEEVGR